MQSCTPFISPSLHSLSCTRPPCPMHSSQSVDFHRSRPPEMTVSLNYASAEHAASAPLSLQQSQLQCASSGGAEGCKSHHCVREKEVSAEPNTDVWGLWPTKKSPGPEFRRDSNDVVYWSAITSDSFWVKAGQTIVEQFPDQLATKPGARDSCDTLGATGANCIRALSNLCEDGKLSEALEAVKQIHQQGIRVPSALFACLLQRCTDEKDTVVGQSLHALIAGSGFEKDCFLGSHLIRMFDSFESLLEANDVFKKLSKPNVYSWSAIIAANAKLGQHEQAIDLYYQMQQSCVKADPHVFVAALKACSSVAALDHGKRIHKHIRESGLESNVFVGSTLIDMYSKCGSLEDAQTVFDMLPVKNVVTWTALIAGYSQQGCGQQALQLFQQMQQKGIKPSRATYVSTLQACSGTESLEQVNHILADAVESGFGSDVIVGNTLIDLYSKCGRFEDACLVFDRLTETDVVAWSALISGYTKHGQFQEAIHAFQQMQQKGILPDEVSFSCVLKACSNDAALDQGKQVHSQILERGLEPDIPIGNTLIDMYSKCGSLEDAHMVFNRMPKQDVVSWTALIGGYAENGHGLRPLQLFKQMQQVAVPNIITFVCILKACTNIGALEDGKQIHADIVESGFNADVLLCTSLVDMYGKCGNLDHAHMVFNRLLKRDVVSWSALMSAYTEHGHCRDALLLFQQMRNDGLLPNAITFMCILKACSSVALLEEGNHIHALIIDMGFKLDLSVGNTLIDMYGKCGKLEDAHFVFDALPNRDTTTWNALIAVYGQNGCGQEALQLFHNMYQEGSDADQVTFVCILKACSSMAALGNGQMIHSHCIRSGLDLDTVVATALIGMYGKCGSLENGRKVFDRMQKRDIITWNALIAEYAQHDNYRMALQSFEDLQRAGLVPNDVTFLCLLSACGHVGLVDEGCLHFKSMRDNHGITPTLEHHNCVVDILGHSRCFCEAEDLLETIAFRSNFVGWTSFLSSCRIHNNVEVGRRCFDHITMMDCGKATPYVLMLKIYMHAGMQEDADRVEELRLRTNAWKKPAMAFTEINHKVHEFTVGDKKHPRSDEIYGKLKALSIQMQMEGYLPRLDSRSNQEKDDALCGHCERLAIALGLIATPQGTTIRVAKNLRVCADCHLATKIISKIELREIVVTDVYRTHHFKDGACSCGDHY